MKFPSPIKLLAALLWSASLVSCGAQSTEPMPDIPETVEYDTVKIEYGDDDLLVVTPELQARALVGDPSGLAAITRETVRGTNRILFQQLALVEAISRFPPTAYEDNVWIWVDQKPGKFTVFTIEKVADGQLRYLLRSGESDEDALPVFSGEFNRADRLDETQQGTGVIRFDLDQLSKIDEDTNSSGNIAIAFRSFNRIRQVRVAMIDVLEEGAENRTNALYEYTQLRNGAGRFRFSSLSDFRNDGEPLERVSLDTAWTPDQSGRAAGRVTGGSLQINEFLLDECWDSGGSIVWADARPNLPTYDDGEVESCAAALRPLMLEAPVYQPPSGDPAVPGPHPNE